MQTYLKISPSQSSAIVGLNDRLRELCEKVDYNRHSIACFPKGGNLLEVIRLLSKHGIKYEMKIVNKEK